MTQFLNNTYALKGRLISSVEATVICVFFHVAILLDDRWPNHIWKKHFEEITQRKPFFTSLHMTKEKKR